MQGSFVPILLRHRFVRAKADSLKKRDLSRRARHPTLTTGSPERKSNPAPQPLIVSGQNK